MVEKFDDFVPLVLPKIARRAPEILEMPVDSNFGNKNMEMKLMDTFTKRWLSGESYIFGATQWVPKER